MADKRIEEQADDLEEPDVNGRIPKSVADFVGDSEPARGTGPEELTPHGPGVTERDGGWTSTAPGR
ncbi:hypothetical protein [Nocardia suismassiliense]|uniref:hypothetical protein n=1 Tax=Nocardia suismassiliense TaxID=2077092 RepID=UPI000D1E4B00|nr:hypothetical protein [Nocardia suismassiliense]